MKLRSNGRAGAGSRPVLTLLLAASLAAAAPARAAESSIARIAKAGRIVIGAHDAAAPISYLGPTGEHIGYQLDVCERVVAAIRHRYSLPGLRTVTVPVTLATRMAMLNNNTVDIDCGPNPVNNASLRQALLTYATIASELAVMTIVDNAGFGVADLAGKSVGLTAGGTATARLRALLRGRQIAVREVFGRDVLESFGLLVDGRVDAVVAPAHYLLAQRALADDPERYVLTDIVLGEVYAAVMFRLEDEDLRATANEAIVALARSGELTRLYDKWFMRPIPGFKRAVEAPASTAQKDIVAAPGSEMLKM